MKKEIKLSIPKFKERPSCPVCFSRNYDIRFNNKIKKKIFRSFAKNIQIQK